MKAKNIGNINLSKEDYLKIKNQSKFMGSGTEATLYKGPSGVLYKLYHLPEKAFLEKKDIEITDDDMKIFSKSDLVENTTFYLPYYVDYNGVKKLYNNYPIKEARARQENIEHTQLPLGSIYVDGRFYGCILKEYSHHQPIHIIKSLPQATRKKIIIALIRNVKELLDNNIYHIDLNAPTIRGKSKGNILLSPTGEVHIIDLDGKSTIYSSNIDIQLQKICHCSLNSLLADLLFDMEFGDNFTEEDAFLLEQIMKQNGIDNTLISRFFDLECNSEELTEIVKKTNYKL